MRSGRVMILCLLILAQIDLYACAKMVRKGGCTPFLSKAPQVKRKKMKVNLKSGCTYLTGIKPSGSIHLGNYIGCLNPIINLEAKRNAHFEKGKTKKTVKIYKIILIADLHSLTSLDNLPTLRKNVVDSVNTILSLIIDMYVKKKKYIQVFINNVKLEHLLQLGKTNQLLKEEMFQQLTRGNTNRVCQFYSFLKNASGNESSYVKHNSDTSHTQNIPCSDTDTPFKIHLEKKNEQNERTKIKKKIKQKHYFSIFRQSDIAQHTSLYYLINSFTSVNMLNKHVHVKNVPKNKSVALLSYPNLMLADILLYKPDYLIVGVDQKKNAEVMKTISKKINSYFPHMISLPKIFPSKFYVQIMNLDGQQKMSKHSSDDLPANVKNAHNIIYLFDEKNIIEEKIKKSKTDNYNELIYAQPDRKEINNLINLFFFFYHYKMGGLPLHLSEPGRDVSPLTQLADKLFQTKQEQTKHNKCTSFSAASKDETNYNDHVTSSEKVYPQVAMDNKCEEEKLHPSRNNINPNINPQIGNQILSCYNNNYATFKYELSHLIYEHFLFPKYVYSVLQSDGGNLVNHVLREGRKCLSRRAAKTFKNFKKRLNI
ncbi:Tryptophanyl-tRNA synthetase [Plasmodium coatneyi]|uniref:Tryptophanyl-tRNA synthetase n=1 Tax=Plasmodium coatneyi TaxID=208452 RepID=A0A1B1E727_9APIC|nr:Tryptophanyl-tRNA synthetase [Plasmodium coatneyi]ANQ10783.1 Tryptophanyl-tRNA synthetase [Plasmodium coatneyi]